MSRKQDTQATPSTGPQALKIGSRVRCADERVEGRIVWANGVSVKIRWDDGEQVTWRRDSLAGRPIEILAVAGDEEQPASPSAPATPEQADRTERPQAGPGTAPATTEPTANQAATPAPEPPAAEPASPVPEAMEAQAGPASGEPAQTSAKLKRQRKAPAEPKEKKLSALDAAAKVLGEAGRPMGCKEMIATMAAKGYWASPAGRTPEATLYSAILRELTTKGDKSRFQKTERGKFALATAG
ncbi:MAG TPA: HTH domain-containing protein [Gemmataceae bacterium]|nr:HTH domain-containing protein [Gemmataceae bacterium]